MELKISFLGAAIQIIDNRRPVLRSAKRSGRLHQRRFS
jgi:hypothetical protein